MCKYIIRFASSPLPRLLPRLMTSCLAFIGVGIAVSIAHAGTIGDRIGDRNVDPVSSNELLIDRANDSSTSPILLAQNATAKAECENKPLVDVKSDTAVRVFCKQGRANEKQKYEITQFDPVFQGADFLYVFQQKLIRKNWYFPSQNESVREVIPKIFEELADADYDGGDQKIGWGGSWVYVLFSHNDKSCFGFRKNRREKLTHGYYCGEKEGTYDSKEIKSMLKKVSLR